MAQTNHRDRLLQGAIECLRTKGYAHTTTRDIAAASNANLASIGYHFGSKEALLNEAIIRGCEEWAQRLGEAAFAGADTSPLGRMAASWMAMIASFEELRPVMVGFIEAVGQSAWSEELREEIAAHYRTVRETVAEMVRAGLGDQADESGADPKVVASFLIAVCDGLVMQWLLDPEEAPSGEQLVESLGAALNLAMQGPGRAPA
jgi:AcrR family transcriptional regulator